MNSFVENMTISIVMAVGSKIISFVWRNAKSEYLKNKGRVATPTYQKSTVRFQFFIALSCGIVCMILLPLVSENFKAFIGTFAFFSFIVVWGCFDAACDSWTDKPFKDKINNDRDDKSN